MRNEEHDKLLSGRVKARFDQGSLYRAAGALRAALQTVLADVPDEELDEAVNAYRLIRALRMELLGLADQS